MNELRSNFERQMSEMRRMIQGPGYQTEAERQMRQLRDYVNRPKPRAEEMIEELQKQIGKLGDPNSPESIREGLRNQVFGITRHQELIKQITGGLSPLVAGDARLTSWDKIKGVKPF